MVPAIFVSARFNGCGGVCLKLTVCRCKARMPKASCPRNGRRPRFSGWSSSMSMAKSMWDTRGSMPWRRTPRVHGAGCFALCPVGVTRSWRAPDAFGAGTTPARLGLDGRVPGYDVRLDWPRDHHHGTRRRGRGAGCPHLRSASRQSPPLRELSSPRPWGPQRTTRRRVTPVSSFCTK